MRPFVAEADVLRPPGALPEDQFMARCIKCERCISVCPTDVLEPLGIERGLLQARTPVLSFANDSCTFCDKCREVCPTAAIGEVDPYAPDQGRIGAAILEAPGVEDYTGLTVNGGTVNIRAASKQAAVLGEVVVRYAP